VRYGHYSGSSASKVNMDLEEVEGRFMDCVDLAQERDRWRALLNEVLNL
jgi:hypothetical protein